jgi:hydrogenase expression/formation protein HypC
MCLAIPGKIILLNESADGTMRTGRVEFSGIIKEVNLELVPQAKVHDYVLVHVGVALGLVDEDEARKTMAYLDQMNELDELYNSPGDDDIQNFEEKSKAIIDKMIDGK